MPVDVIDNQGNHIGIISSLNHENLGTFLVALTSIKAADLAIDYQGIKKFLSNRFKTKSILGVIDEDQLNRKIAEIWEENYGEWGPFREDLALRLVFLREINYPQDIEKNIHIDQRTITGYLFLDRSNIKFANQAILIENDIDYIYAVANPFDSPVLYGKIIDYPVITYEKLTLGEPRWESTRIKILSGNVIQTFDLEISLYVKKDMTILMQMEKQKVVKIFCDGIIYEMPGMLFG